MTLFEVNEAAEIIKKTAHPEVNIIFGAVIDETMADQVRLTVIATGFDTAAQHRPSVLQGLTPATSKPKIAAPSLMPSPDFQTHGQHTDNLDIPAFLRRR